MYNLIEFEEKCLRTPVDLLQILTAGGIRMGTITEVYGANASGKSSFAYSTAAMFQEDNKYGLVHVIDVEGSADYIRFKNTFKMDLERTIVKNETSLEGAFEYIASVIANVQKQLACKVFVEDVEKYSDKELKKFCEDNKIETSFPESSGKNSEKEKSRNLLICELLYNGVIREKNQLTPHLIVWDSLAASRSRSAVESLINEGKSAMNQGGLLEKPRINTDKMNIVLSSIAKKPITLMVLNQVSLTGFASYTGPKETSSGGNAVKHAAHYRFYFKKLKHTLSENKRDIIGTISEITVEKAKFCPKVEKTQVFIDDTVGGRIVPKFELPMVAKELGILINSGSYFYFTSEDGKKINKAYWWAKSSARGKTNHIEDNEEVRKICQEKITRHYRKVYSTVDDTYKYLDNPIGSEGVDERCFSGVSVSDKEVVTNDSEINDSDLININN